MPAHMLGNDTHVRATKIISNNFLHAAHMSCLQLFIQESIRRGCIFFVHDGKELACNALSVTNASVPATRYAVTPPQTSLLRSKSQSGTLEHSFVSLMGGPWRAKCAHLTFASSCYEFRRKSFVVSLLVCSSCFPDFHLSFFHQLFL